MAMVLYRLKVFRSLEEAKQALNRNIAPVAMKLQRTGVNINLFVGEENVWWHPEVVKVTVTEAGWHFKKLLGWALDHEAADRINLREEASHGSLIFDGSLNDWYERARKPGDRALDPQWGLTELPNGNVRLRSDPSDSTTPNDNPAGWRHAIGCRDGLLLDNEISMSAESLWLGNDNRVDKQRGYLYQIHKVYRIFKCSRPKNNGCRGECAKKRRRSERACGPAQVR